MTDLEHSLPVVLYRLVDPVDGRLGGAWGEGLLTKLARDERYEKDSDLMKAILQLLEQPWEEDPLREGGLLPKPQEKTRRHAGGHAWRGRLARSASAWARAPSGRGPCAAWREMWRA